jgi:hypothetical protein
MGHFWPLDGKMGYMGWKIDPFMMSTCCDGCDGIETFFGMHHIMNLLKTSRNGIPDDGKLPGLIWSFLVKMMTAQWGEPDLRWGYGGTPRICNMSGYGRFGVFWEMTILPKFC